jgi:hypothetical protein
MRFSSNFSSALRQSRAEAVCLSILARMERGVNAYCGQAAITREVSEIVGGREALAA